MRKISMKRKTKTMDLNSSESSEIQEKMESEEENGTQDNNSNHGSEIFSPKKNKKKIKKAKKSSSGESSVAESNGTEEAAGSESPVEEQYEVEAILDQKMVKGEKHFFIRWKGYESDSNTWEPESTVNCPELVTKFLASKKSTDSKSDSNKKSKKRASQSPNKSSKKSKVNSGDEATETPSKSSKKSKMNSDDEATPSKSPKKSKMNSDDETTPIKSPKKSKMNSDDEATTTARKLSKKSKMNSDDEESSDEYEVDRILEVHHKKTGKREFLVHWKGYTNSDNTWEPEEHMNCPNLVDKFMAKVNKAKESVNRELRVNRKPTEHFTLSMVQIGRRLSRRNQGKQRAQYKEFE